MHVLLLERSKGGDFECSQYDNVWFERSCCEDKFGRYGKTSVGGHHHVHARRVYPNDHPGSQSRTCQTPGVGMYDMEY